VRNPSAAFLAERPAGAPGSAVLATLEGSRPVLVEIQALVSRSGLALPRRTAIGLDAGRVALLLAVLEKRLGMPLHDQDVLLNVALLAVFAVILMRPQLLGYAKGGKWYLTWLSIGVITLMDELTSVFYAPAEAHRFIGMKAIFFIAFTSLIMRVLSTRMVEISEIL